MEFVGVDFAPRTLAIDIGGSGLKMVVLGPSGEPLVDRSRKRTPKPATPGAVLEVLTEMLSEQMPFERVAVGFPGVVVDGKILTAPNLHKSWIGFDFASALAETTGRPARVANDADVHGFAVIEGVGVELVLTLGTGLGSALYVDRRLVPNLEVAHHDFRRDRSYEECLGVVALERYGSKKWNKLLAKALDQLHGMFNYRKVYIGGGNAKKVHAGRLPEGAELVSNMAGLLGCIYLWEPLDCPGEMPEPASDLVAGTALAAQ